MTIWSKIRDLFTIDDYYMDETFSLGDRPLWNYEDSGESGENKSAAGINDNQKPEDADEQADYVPVESKITKQGGFVKPKRPLKLNQLSEIDGQPVIEIHSQKIYSSLELNLVKLKARFHIPPNADVIIREFSIALDPPVRAAIALMEGLAARNNINDHILQPLMILTNLEREGRNQDVASIVMDRLLPGNQVEEKDAFDDLVQGILSGATLVLIDGSPVGLLVETKGWEHRTVGQPNVESVVRGPQEAFVEHLRVNTALVRRRLRCDTLVTDMFKLGSLSNTDCALLYIDGLINPKLVEEIKRRIKSVRTDYITDSGTLGQFIEDSTTSIIPGQLFTERPDRAAAHLVEGHFVVIVDGDPFAMIAPSTFWSLVHAAEDAYMRWPFATLVRMIRVLAMFITLLLPSFYISIVNYHPEMIPTDLLLAIAASRETIPFPAIWEVVSMEIAFELIREAGIRVPSLIGSTLGIVGAIVLGQAAVAANIISPILVIIIALTGLGSFAIPNYDLSLAIRALRFVFLFLSAILGFYGLAIGVFMVVVHICGQKSLGVPIMSPVSPFRPPSGDVIRRLPVYRQELRPTFLRPQESQRQPHINRTWDPGTELLERGGKSGKDNGQQGGKKDGAN